METILKIALNVFVMPVLAVLDWINTLHPLSDGEWYGYGMLLAMLWGAVLLFALNGLFTLMKKAFSLIVTNRKKARSSSLIPAVEAEYNRMLEEMPADYGREAANAVEEPLLFDWFDEDNRIAN